MAITDLTINSDRVLAIDFTPSFMNLGNNFFFKFVHKKCSNYFQISIFWLGIALLFRKPKPEEPKAFSFMKPFSAAVWICLGAAYFLVFACFYWLGRFSASQWENRYPCIEEPTFLENQFTLNNSMWFAAGAILQQGSEIEPK